MSNKPLTDSILLVVLGIIIAVLFSERACNSGEPQKNDTTYIKGNPDTIIVHDTISNTIYKPEPYAVYPSPVDSPIGINDLDSIRIYLTSIYDSAADVVVRDSVRGFLLHKDTQVRIKNRTITQIDTLKINIPTPFNNKSLKLGLGMAMNDSLQPIGYAVGIKGNLNYLVGYNIPRKRILIGIGVMLKSK